jgi:WD40 repeat protein
MENNIIITSYKKVTDIITGPAETNTINNAFYCTPDGKYIAISSNDLMEFKGVVRVYNSESREYIIVIEEKDCDARSIAISPNNRYIVYGLSNSLIKIHDIQSSEFVSNLEGHSSGVQSICISSNGKYIVSGSVDKSVRLWNFNFNSTNRFKCDKVMEGHSDVVTSVASSLDCNNIVSGSIDKSIKVWNVLSGDCIATLTGHYDGIMSIAFSSDNRRIASGSIDKSVRIWNIDSKKCIKIINGFEKTVNKVIWSSDDKQIVCSDYNNVNILDADTTRDTKFISRFNIEASVSSVSLISDSNKIIVLEFKRIIIFEKEKINLGSFPLLTSEYIFPFEYVNKIMSNYTYFTKYFLKNYLVTKNKNKEIKNMNYAEMFNNIEDNLSLINLSKFADIIIEFINSIPNELNEPFYNLHRKGTNDTRKFFLNIYKNIIQEYIKFLNNSFKKNKEYGFIYVYKTTKNNELQSLLHNFKKFPINPVSGALELSPLSRIVIRYNIGSNEGGLSREFFKKLEIQLNYKQDLLDMKKKLNNLGIKSERNLIEIENINSKIKNIIDLQDENIIDVLVLSKVNDNPIYINNNKLKILILNKIVSNIKKHLNKNFIYNFLYNDGKIDYSNPSSFLLDGTNNLSNTNYSEAAIKKYIKNKTNSNKNIINSQLLSNKNIINSQNNSLLKYISSEFIDKNNVYRNFLDFYISHFIKFELSADDIINKLNFLNTTPEFKLKFKALLKNLSGEELKKFNSCISGSFKEQIIYTIEIMRGNIINNYSTYHTCFSKMDIWGMENFITNFLQFENNSNNYKKLILKDKCRKDFMETVDVALATGFNMD